MTTFIHKGLLNPPSGVEDGLSLGVMSRHVEAGDAADLAFVLSAAPNPAESGAPGETITFTVTPTATGASQTSLSVSVSLTWPTEAGDEPVNTLNGWTMSVAWALVAETWSATFTKATFAIGSTPTFSFTTNAAQYTGSLQGDLTAGGSAEDATATLTDVNVSVALVDLDLVWDDATVAAGVGSEFTVSHTPNGYPVSSAVMTVTLDTGSTTSSPTTVSNPDGWSIGTWTAPGGGTQWTCSMSQTSTTDGVTETVTFATTPSTAGSLIATVSATNAQSIGSTNASDTLVVTAGMPSYIGAGTAVTGNGALTMNNGTHQANDILICAVENAYTTSADATLSTANGFAAITGVNYSNAGLKNHTTLFWKRAASGSETAPVVADNGELNAARIYTFRGCVTSGDPWDVFSSAGDGDASLSVAGNTTTGDGRLVAVFVGGIHNSATASLGSWANADLANITERDDTVYDVDGSKLTLALVTGEKATAGAYGATTATWSTIPSGIWATGITLALKP